VGLLLSQRWFPNVATEYLVGQSLMPISANHVFDQASLVHYLGNHLDGFSGPCDILQFQGGQSNPTFRLETSRSRYVLRKKPPGRLLPSAHAIDREFRVLTALSQTCIPVPRPRLLCVDPSVIGTSFYVMDYVEGRVFSDPLLIACDAAHRTAIYEDMGRILAELHKVNYRAIGLEDFGNSGDYLRRQIKRWSAQYTASAIDSAPEMELLITWLQQRVPEHDETALTHGDFRLGNFIFHPTEPRALVLLDWELSTLGHPLADLAHCCMAWQLTTDLGGMRSRPTVGIPNESEYVAKYCERTQRSPTFDWQFFMAFALFRWAAIAAGVYRRALNGNAADSHGHEAGAIVRGLATRAWELATGSALRWTTT
jgi:aminoglycoside phosphotransferase (APT) family kinase protein